MRTTTNLDQFASLTATWVAERAKLFTGGDSLTAATNRAGRGRTRRERPGDGRSRGDR